MQKYNFTLEFKNGLFSDFVLIDQWLDILNVEQNLQTFTNTNDIFAHKILYLFSNLMEAIKIPLFDAGKITTIIQNNKDVEINLSLNKIDYIPKEIYTQILNISVNLLINDFQKPITPKNTQKLFEYLQNHLIIPFSNVAGSGKSTIPLLKIAFKNNIPFKHLNNGVYQLGWGVNSRLFNRSIIDSDSAIGSQISQNKLTTTLLLEQAGLPSSTHFISRDEKETLQAKQYLGYPLVVKPVDKDRGEGITTDIWDENTLLKAFKEAFSLSISKQVIIEKQVPGICHRVFVAKNKVLYAVKRMPIYILGDGKKTISQLIDHENKIQEKLPPWKRTLNYPKDKETIEILNSYNMSFETILNKNQSINLRKIESTQWGGIDEDVSKSIHQENIYLALKAAKLFKLDVAGIDIITPDISKPWYENGAIINEINFSPLLGGGDISKKAIPTFLDTYINENGRIPISIYIGDNALEKALDIQNKKFKQKHNLFIISENKCINPDSSIYHLNTRNIYESCEALLMDIEVESIIVATKTDPFFKEHLPIDKIDTLELFSNTSKTWINLGKNILSDDYHRIIKNFSEKNNEVLSYFTQGNELRKKAKYEEAKDSYKKALAINPYLPEIYNNLAVTHLRLKDLPKAIKEYRKAVELLLKIDFSKVSLQKKETFDTKYFEIILYKTLVLLAQNQIQAFPTSGTLLGLERQGSLLPFDKDIDIGLPFEQIKQATFCLLQNGWEEIEDSFGLLSPKAFLHKKSGLTLDLVGFKKEKNKNIIFGGFYLEGIPEEWQRITEHHNMELEKVQYKNEGKGWSLKFPKQWLVSIYGPNWETPDKSFNTIFEAYNLRSFSLLTQCYAYSNIIKYFAQGKLNKILKITKICTKNFPDDELFIKLEKYLNNEK